MCQFCDFRIWFLSQFNGSVKKITASVVERVEYHCQKHERWVNSRSVMSRHGWSLYHGYLQPPKFSFWVHGDFSRTLCVSRVYCWQSTPRWTRRAPFTDRRWTEWPWTFFCSSQHIMLSKAESPEKRAQLPYLQGKMEMGENNKLLYSAENWLLKISGNFSRICPRIDIRSFSFFFFFLSSWISLAFTSSKHPLPSDRLFATFQE